MKWIEFIQVRSSRTTQGHWLPSLTAECSKLTKPSSMLDFFIMQHGLFDEDVAIVLLWDNDTKPEKTREGLLLAAQLQQWGQTTHAVWIPVHHDIS